MRNVLIEDLVARGVGVAPKKEQREELRYLLQNARETVEAIRWLRSLLSVAPVSFVSGGIPTSGRRA